MSDHYTDPYEDDEGLDEEGEPLDERPPPESFASRVIPDVVRRALMTGVGAVLLGEEGLRNSLGEMKMPKEAMSYLVSQADKTKREAINSLARELRGFLNSLDLQSILEKAVAGTTIEIQTTVRVIPKEGGGVGLEVMENATEVSRPEGDEAGAAERPKKKASRAKKKQPKSDESDDSDDA